MQSFLRSEQDRMEITLQFWPQLMKYCIQDLDVLTIALNSFECNMNRIVRLDTFVECFSLPGFVNLIQEVHFLPGKTIALLPYMSSPRLRQYSAQALQ